jgi:hypothetical protein
MKNKNNVKDTVNEFMIDILGSMVPGVIFFDVADYQHCNTCNHDMIVMFLNRRKPETTIRTGDNNCRKSEKTRLIVHIFGLFSLIFTVFF